MSALATTQGLGDAEMQKLKHTVLMTQHIPYSLDQPSPQQPTLQAQKYDQQLLIYHSLSKIYQRLGRCIEQYPPILVALQYSIAAIHGTTLYLLSVILSIAQLIMITFTVENLDWIQTHKPLMCEWDSRFPGFVFPAMDIESEDEEDPLEESIDHKGGRYWASKKKLKGCTDSDVNAFSLEESQKRLTIKQSMNSTIRRRLAKYQQWIPCYWAAEESIALEDSDDQEGYLSDSQRHNLVSKRVTFNEKVLVFGRRRSSQVSQPPPYGMTPMMKPIIHAHESVAPTTEDLRVANNAPSQISAKEVPFSIPAPPKPSHPPADVVALDALLQEEAKYQEAMASEDVNGSGSSSPVFQPDPQRTSVSPSPSPILSTFQGPIHPPHPSLPLPPNSAPSIPEQPVQLSHVDDTLYRKKLMKISALLHLHHHHGHDRSKNTVSRSSTRTDLEEAPQPQPLSGSAPISRQSSFESDAIDLTTVPSQQGPKHDTISPRSSMSLKTRARRSLSLGLARHNLNDATAVEGGDSDNASLDHGSNEKHKNLMYRIAHPQRYKRELEQHLTEKEHQRLLALVDLQHRLILGSEGENTCSNSKTSGSIASPTNTNTALCGNAYYYATSAEFVEGLGAPDSMISTSIGTSFPEELQTKKSKSRAKQVPPLVVAAAIACNGATEGGPAETTEQHSQRSPHRSLFKRDSKKSEAGSGSGARSLLSHSPSHLHQLFPHPGHKHTQSTASLIRPTSTCSETALARYGQSTPAFTNSNRFGSCGRTNSRNFSTFTALGVPANPPVETAVAPPNVVCPISAMLPSHDPAMEHTTFASFSFPSPEASPINSASPSPRNSLSVASASHAINEIRAEVIRNDTALQVENLGSQEPEARENQQQQPEMPLEDKSVIMRATDLEANNNNSTTSSSDPVATKPQRSFNFIRKLTLCVAFVSSVQAQTLDQLPQSNNRDQTVNDPEQAVLEYIPPKLTEEQAKHARQDLKEILDKVPVRTVEPLFSSVDGYCEAFEALCAYSCQERLREQAESDQDEGDAGVNDDDIDEQEDEIINGCAVTNARSVVQAKAKCQCVGFDMTDRINFGIVGGIVSSKTTASSKPESSNDFSAESASDGLVTLSGNPTFQTVMTVVTNICTYVDRLNSITNPQVHKPSPSPPPSNGGGLFGFISSLVPSVGTMQELSPLIPIINGLLGNGDFGIKTEMPIANAEKPPVSPVIPSKPKIDNDGGWFGWFPHLWGNTDVSKKSMEHTVAGQDQIQSKHKTEMEIESQLIDGDGRIAKITRVQRRQTKKSIKSTSSEQKQNDRKDL
ncbi:hypothetical protein BGX27_002245 [Mortierella sp. AM989]|nr:hypothetical protein BGX27_002245 [Mortierella sp. AM989]